MNNIIVNQLSNQLYELGKKWGFSKPIICTDRYTSQIYIIRKHALQLEIDWTDYTLFMYVVYLKNQELPNNNVIYTYKDGHWCRKFLEEIYQTKRPRIKDQSRRYSLEYLFDCFAFYSELISNNPNTLTEYFDSIEAN